MEARHVHVQTPQLHRRALLRSGAAAGAAIILAATVALLLRTNPSVARHDGPAAAAPAVATAPASSPALEYPGALGHFPDAPEEQPSTF